MFVGDSQILTGPPQTQSWSDQLYPSELFNTYGEQARGDYKTSRFEGQIEKVDVVFDAVGGETLDRSWGVLKPGGRMVTIAADSEGTTDQRVKDAFFVAEPKKAAD